MPAQPPPGFRADIEGLRAVAIGAVLLAHAGIAQAAGGYVGVDVFFVISGFLITRGLAGQLASTGRIRLLEFYGRRARRLLPLALLVLAATAVAAAVVLSPVRNESVGRDLVASAAYVVNWRFAIEAVDYFAVDDLSPVQHFWSLAVEEQFYLVFPALLLAATWALTRRRRRRAVGPALWLLVGGATAASLAYALHATASGPAAAYFSTLARAWELGVGALVALALGRARRVPAAVGGPLAAAGLVAIAVATLRFDATTTMPGLPALLPTLGAAAVIVGGTGRQLALLTNRPVRLVGRLSYSWYLWHWPFVVFAQALWPQIGTAGLVAATAASAIPAAVSHRLVELPLLHAAALRRPRRSLALGAATTAVAAACGVLVLTVAAAPTVPRLAAADALGAQALPSRAPVQRVDAVRPTPSEASGDRGLLYRRGCLAEPEVTAATRCAFGRGSTTVVMVGDSHTLHWFPALYALARRQHWRLVTYVKAGCGVSDVTLRNNELGRTYRECDTWRRAALARVRRERPDVVFTTQFQQTRVVARSGTLSAADSRAAVARGYPAALRALRRGGARVVLMGDTPVAPRNVPECVSGHLRSLRTCAFRRAAAAPAPAANARAAAEAAGAAFVQPLGKLCPRGVCPAVVGGTLVYRDDHHLSATFSRTLATWLGRQLRAAGVP